MFQLGVLVQFSDQRFCGKPNRGMVIRIGMGVFSPTNSAIRVAEERGFFKKHGIEAEAIFIGGGAARGVNALLAGDIQFATAGGGAVITPAT